MPTPLPQVPRLRRAYCRLADGLSELIEEGHLTRQMIPEDYHWLVGALVEIVDLAAVADAAGLSFAPLNLDEVRALYPEERV